ncbi:VOC family protein [Lentisphaera profundi]|uniref:VOC family protein n=1 Tax=Lentisphaera profundi TaxID=1658616 RepID=A0ABY7VQU6_9BACT|nr:VOC family protein [Lentisphaera profundi]WDE96067.1 VOC family protein [Lentisphaera profundi]
MKARISMVSLGVTDLDRSVKFYKDLGFPLFQALPNAAFFDLNGSWLGLCVRSVLAKDIGMSPEGSGFSAINMAHNVSSEQEVDDLIEEAKNAGAKLIKEPQKAEWGGYHAYFSDPDGHLWEIAYNPFAWIGPED